jgi:16S rRNA (uracil1498-N3)-methyltransferase
MRDVLRLGVGDEVSVFDGDGHEWRCRIGTMGKKSAELVELTPMTPTSAESPMSLAIAAALLKGEKSDLVIQKSVELGVDTLIPLQTERGDMSLKDLGSRLERWRRIALEATKQCGRAKLMTVAEPLSFGSFLQKTADQTTIMFSEREGGSFAQIEVEQKVCAVIGPKGGWDDAELNSARSAGILIVTLGGRILRAETAAIALTAILQHRFGDLN